MKLAEYPERTCREPVSSDLLMYTCELAEEHDGPCASYSSVQSVRAREAWEKRQAEQAAAIPAPVKKTSRTRRRRRTDV